MIAVLLLGWLVLQLLREASGPTASARERVFVGIAIVTLALALLVVIFGWPAPDTRRLLWP